MERCACPLCGPGTDPSSTEPGATGRTALPVSSSWCVAENCRLVYLNPRPTEDEIADLYPPDYGPHQVVRRRLGLLRGIDVGYGMSKRVRFVERHSETRGRTRSTSAVEPASSCLRCEIVVGVSRARRSTVNAAGIAIEAGLDVRTWPSGPVRLRGGVRLTW